MAEVRGRHRRTWWRAAVVAALAGMVPALGPVGPAPAPAPSGAAPAPTGGAGPEPVAVAAAAARAGADEVTASAVTGSTYRPVSPRRVLDTRLGLGAPPFMPGAPQSVLVVTPEVAADAGVAAGQVTAVVLNVTATGPAGESFVAVWPAGEPWRGASNLNVARPGQTVPNLVTSPVTAGRVALLSVAATHLVADVQGVYVADDAPTVGRFVPLGPVRAYDTRVAGGPLAPGEARVVDLRPAGVPADAIAVAATVTAVVSPGDQYLVVWPADRPMPWASNLNPEYAGQTVANQVISGLDGGRARVLATAGGHVVIDVAGYYTGPSSGAGDDGLFVPVAPSRLLDTRQRHYPVAPGGSVEVPVANRAAVPGSGVAAVALNVTATQANAGGFLTVWAARAHRPNSSVLNPEYPNQTVPSHVITPVTDLGFAMYSPTGTHLLADIAGYFTGPPAARASGPPATGPHTFLYTATQSGVARWDPCRAIRYLVNDDHAVPGDRALLDEAVAKAEAAAGLDLVHAGETTAGLDGATPAGVDAVLAFAPADLPLLGGAAGLGGGSYTQPALGDGRVVKGFAMFVSLPGSSTLRHQQQRDLILHELGHLLGLGHVPAYQSEVMYPVVQPHTDYQAGDRHGLWRLGAEQGCFTTGLGALGAEPEPTVSTRLH